ncbi:uncharacterized protein LOC129591828 [Paramacrobiotus metropolitanus]|uniref:uncharacterized protein LOC129591828 n=1 Tax=Paramacrobiotus metropolitanus TaxID=2943436 RepID=UPI00244592D2|nr:uncharacterized protein LOC129591828 [Paramacrobiotus metropolitanus]
MDCGKRRRISLASLQEMSREHALRLNHRYDCVDVWSDEGPLQFGRVVDAGSDGLFIDFLCPGRRRHFVLFGRRQLASVYTLRSLEMNKAEKIINWKYRGSFALSLVVRAPPTYVSRYLYSCRL